MQAFYREPDRREGLLACSGSMGVAGSMRRWIWPSCPVVSTLDRCRRTGKACCASRKVTSSRYSSSPAWAAEKPGLHHTAPYSNSSQMLGDVAGLTAEHTWGRAQFLSPKWWANQTTNVQAWWCTPGMQKAHMLVWCIQPKMTKPRKPRMCTL